MIEINPQFSYSPEGIFNVTTRLGEGYEPDTEQAKVTIQHQLDCLETLSKQPGISVDDSDGQLSLSVVIAERFKRKFTNSGNPDVAEFLHDLARTLPFPPNDLTDRVVDIDYLTDRGAGANINHHFQRWLNSAEQLDDALHHAALAMAIPFGNSDVRKAQRQFKIYGDGENRLYATAWTSDIAIQLANFGLLRSDETPEYYSETMGRVAWKQVILSTLGNCACWGVYGETRQHLRIKKDNMRLYEMNTHNVDTARQSLSLLLGMGALTYYASLYEGQENVFADVEWDEAKQYPKIQETTP